MEDIISRERFSRVTAEKEMFGEFVIYADETIFIYASASKKGYQNSASQLVFRFLNNLIESRTKDFPLQVVISDWVILDDHSSEHEIRGGKFEFSEGSIVYILGIVTTREEIDTLDALRKKWSAMRTHLLKKFYCLPPRWNQRPFSFSIKFVGLVKLWD